MRGTEKKDKFSDKRLVKVRAYIMAAVAPAPKPRRKSSQRRKEEHFWIIPEVVDEIKMNRETGVAQVYRQWRQGRYLGKVCVRRAPLPLPLLLFYTYANTLLPPLLLLLLFCPCASIIRVVLPSALLLRRSRATKSWRERSCRRPS